MFRDKTHFFKVLDGQVGNSILASSRSRGFIGLTFYDAGARSFYAKKPINTPDDLKGMKIRVQQSPTTIKMIQALGASPTPMPWGEVYPALQAGVVDGAENNITALTTGRHGEVSKFFSLTEHQMVPDVLVISRPSGTRSRSRCRTRCARPPMSPSSTSANCGPMPKKPRPARPRRWG